MGEQPRQPEGLRYRPEFVTPAEERQVLGELEAMELRTMHGPYVLAGPARSSWQYSIPATRALRWSVTFRTLRAPRGREP
jgi:hypothetical protein